MIVIGLKQWQLFIVWVTSGFMCTSKSCIGQERQNVLQYITYFSNGNILLEFTTTLVVGVFNKKRHFSSLSNPRIGHELFGTLFNVGLNNSYCLVFRQQLLILYKGLKIICSIILQMQKRHARTYRLHKPVQHCTTQ